MIHIKSEADEIASGKQPRDTNIIAQAPHTIATLTLPDDQWNRPYTRAQAAYPLPWLRKQKFWPSVGRVNDAFGDMNLIVRTLQLSFLKVRVCLLTLFSSALSSQCECPTVEELAEEGL